MTAIVRPLEHRIYSWLIANTTRPTNDTHFPGPQPTGAVEVDWLQGIDLPLQDVSLGTTTLLALVTCFQGTGRLLRSTNSLTEKWNATFHDVVVVNTFKTFLGLALLLVSVPLVLPITCIFWGCSCCVSLLYTLKFGSCVTKVEGMDNMWGVESQESRPFITISIVLSGVPNLDKITRHIQTMIMDKKDSKGEYKYKKFRQVFSQTYGYNSWTNVEDFKIENHVRVINLRKLYSSEADSGNTSHQAESHSADAAPAGPTPATNVDDDELVLRYLNEEGEAALPPDRPPWEMILLAREDNRYNAVVRLHHAIADGVSLIRLWMEALVDTPLQPPRVGPPPPSTIVRAALMVWSALVLPLGLLKVVANFDYNSLHGRPLSGRKVMAASRAMPLAMLKKVKLAAHATVNDVLMTCLAAALSKHFSRRSEDVPKVTAAIPVSLHGGRQPSALTNCFSVATVNLPAGRALTPTARLAATKKVLDGMKRDPTLEAVFWVVRVISQVLPARVAQLLVSGKGVTLAASNVPGPQQEVSVWGDTVEDLLFWVPNRAPVGVGVSFASYMGVVRVGVNVDDALIHSRQEAQVLLQDMEDELHTLYHYLLLEE
ncbi:uncharacterized protein [Procambarus clarkii]|uniref:uncharacterized protein n=1 Tax=Procambarus clarkii TaxID=6728 RepID=UPI003743DBD7